MCLSQPHLQALLSCEEVVPGFGAPLCRHHILSSLPCRLAVGKALPLDKQTARLARSLSNDTLNL